MRVAAGVLALLMVTAGCGAHEARTVAVARPPVAPRPSPTVTPPPDCKALKCIAITFDDGPGPYTDKLLGMLAEYRAHSTFFVLGGNAKAYPKELKNEVAAGMEVGDHTYDHKDLTTLSSAGIHSEVKRTQHAIESIGGVTPKVLRPPYGAIDAKVRKAVGLPMILWKDDTLDWRDRNAKIVSRRVQKMASRNAVILLHDIHPTSVQAMATVLPALTKRGYTLVPVSTLYAGQKLKPGHAYGME